MTPLYLLMLAVFIGYVLMVYIRYGILSSISESYYWLSSNQKILFTLFCWGFAFPSIILGNSVLAFIAGGGIVFVGASPAFKEHHVQNVHTIGAFTGIIFSWLYILFDAHMAWLAIIELVLIISLMFLKRNRIWWIEIVAFSSFCLSLLN